MNKQDAVNLILTFGLIYLAKKRTLILLGCGFVSQKLG